MKRVPQNQKGEIMLFFRYTLFVALGGAIGSVFRFWLSEFIHIFLERGFPWGTLSVNFIGSFFMGFLSVYLLQKFPLSDALRSFLLIGLLGGFTTFSTFTLDVLTLLQTGKIYTGFLYILASVILCLSAGFLGIFLAS